MTNEEIRMAIAKSVGWRKVSVGAREGMWRRSSLKGSILLADGSLPPDFCNDLNAMHEVEMGLELNDWTPYLDALDKICVPTHICPTTHAMSTICATARQRAEAYLKAKNLWKE